MSLRFKTMTGVALIEALLLGYLILTVLGFMKDSAELALIKRAETTLALFAATAKDPLLSFDLATLDAFTSELLTNPDIAYVRVVGPDDTLMSSAIDPNFEAKPFVQDYYLNDVDDHVFDTSTNISEGGIVYGSVQLGISTDSIKRTIESAKTFSVTIAVTEMFLVAMFSLLLGTYLTRQLVLLQQAAKKISAGNYDGEIPVSSKDEVADVAKAFNKMSATLRESQKLRDKYEQELLELNQTLEDRVERRTLKIEQQVNELQATNQRLSKTREQLVQTEKTASIGRLAAGLSHEINNPISFVHSNLDTLSSYIEAYRKLRNLYNSIELDSLENTRELVSRIAKHEKKYDLESIDEDIEELITDAIKGTGRIRDIVKGLNDFSSMKGTAKEPLNLNECIEQALNTAKNTSCKNKNVKTDLQDIPLVYGSPTDINQVLTQLLENSADAISDIGNICVSTYIDAEHVVVCVTDNGTGIAPENFDTLFEPFFTTKAVGKGTGLGLAITYGIVKDHDGDITVESEPGQKTQFMIKLPALQQANIQSAA